MSAGQLDVPGMRVSQRFDQALDLRDVPEEWSTAAVRTWEDLGVDAPVGALSEAEELMLETYNSTTQHRSGLHRDVNPDGTAEVPAPEVRIATGTAPGPRIVRGVAVPLDTAVPIGRTESGVLLLEEVASGAIGPAGNLDGKTVPLRHAHDSDRQLGHLLALEEHDGEARFDAVVADHQLGRDIVALIAAGSLRQCSIGFAPAATEERIVPGLGKILRRTRLELVELSLVPLGAYVPYSRITEVSDETVAEARAAGARRRNQPHIERWQAAARRAEEDRVERLGRAAALRAWQAMPPKMRERLGPPPQ